LDYETLRYEQTDHVVTLTYNRPDQHNAVNRTMNAELHHAWQRFRDDDDAFVLVITGAGDTTFCAGWDLADAASLTETVEALAPRFRTARVEASFGASSALARQIRDGAPADVFLSASPDWIDFLREANALDGAPIVLARNELVCVTAAESDVAKRGVTDAAGLLVALGKHGLVAIADEGVPAGEYARAALKALG